MVSLAKAAQAVLFGLHAVKGKGKGGASPVHPSTRSGRTGRDKQTGSPGSCAVRPATRSRRAGAVGEDLRWPKLG